MFSQDATQQTLMFLMTAIETFVSSTSGLKMMSGALILQEWAKSCQVWCYKIFCFSEQHF